MSLVDYASSSDEEREEEELQHPLNDSPLPPPPPPPPPPRNQTKSGSSSASKPEKKPHSSPLPVEKLPDASLLLSSPAVSSNLINSSDHSSRVAAALAENASRKRDSNGMTSSAIRSKVPRGNMPPSRDIPDTAGGMLVPPQISGRKNVVTEDLSKLFVKKQNEN